MTRDELVLLVDKIMKCQGSEKEIDEMIELLEKNVTDPEVTNYIFYEENTPEEVVDKALAYKPIILQDFSFVKYINFQFYRRQEFDYWYRKSTE